LANLSLIINIIKVALGLGFVIFLHELGHFLLAKWNGVKVEKFSIGFGPTLLGFKKGETDYVIAAVPLGGFVKMLGEGPDEEATKSSDPRAYPNKSVSARMAIISAGVIMNLILGLACFVYAYGMGMVKIPTRIGAVKAGAPAYLAGVHVGDEIVEMDGRTNLNFDNVTLRVHLSGDGQVIHFKLKRPGQEAPVSLDIEPQRGENAEVPGIGVGPSRSLILGLLRPITMAPFQAPAGLSEPVKAPDAGFKALDKVVAVGPHGQTPTPVHDSLEFDRLMARHSSEPMDVVVERETKPAKGAAPSTERVTVTLPPNRFVTFGFRLKIEPIAAIQAGSPAERAGFREGDRIVKVDGRDDFDPMQLPTLCFEHAGRPMKFEVERPDAGSQTKTLMLEVTPDDTPPWSRPSYSDEPLDVPGLGLAYPVRTKIEAVEPGSPSAEAGLKVGDVITAISLPPEKSEKRPTKPITLDDKTSAWPSAFQALQLQPLEPVELRVNNSDRGIRITPRPDPNWFHPQRGTRFQILTRQMPPLSVSGALQRGWDDTVENILSIYAMFRSLAQSRVSPKNLGGPILIAEVAYSAADQGLTDLIFFLGILSINLAVLNFLPIPPLDGGQMIFLLAEKVRGRPLPDTALIAGTYVGLLFVLGLMAFVIYQDVYRLVTNYL
jgi:regulator of sigma E protease